MRRTAGILFVIITIGYRVCSVECQEALIPLSSDQYAVLQDSTTIQCDLPSFNKSYLFDPPCLWWQDGQLLPFKSMEYSVSVSESGVHCWLQITQVKEWDAAPTHYRCGAGERLESASPVTVRLWIKVEPKKIKLKIVDGGPALLVHSPSGRGQSKFQLNLTEITSSIPPTIRCRSTSGRPAPRLYFELDGRVLQTWPEVIVSSDRLLTTSIYWRDDQRRLVARSNLKCWSKDPSHSGFVRQTAEITFVGQYPKSSSPDQNVIMQAAIGGAVVVILVIVIVALVVVIVKRKKRIGAAKAKRPGPGYPLPRLPSPTSEQNALIFGRPLPSIRNHQHLQGTTPCRDSYLVPKTVHLDRQMSSSSDATLGKQVVLRSVKTDSTDDDENAYYEISTENYYITLK